MKQAKKKQQNNHLKQHSFISYLKPDPSWMAEDKGKWVNLCWGMGSLLHLFLWWGSRNSDQDLPHPTCCYTTSDWEKSTQPTNPLLLPKRCYCCLYYRFQPLCSNICSWNFRGREKTTGIKALRAEADEEGQQNLSTHCFTVQNAWARNLIKRPHLSF